ncbi:unnamed protein product [Darwinula stevensoni]|uniref:Uncharacterized protein n=1 Tax=Darwinula stevensoni TaxID=69355 RepID=A0A7R9A5I3_9CRUS|nr:unnamed protein product [Darwinula stevensoni]CAG0894422.1 unnamed protein product [Darwinula stevensoni]
MSDFLEREAEEDDEEDDDLDEEEKRKLRKLKKLKDENEERMKEELKDLIADDDEEEEEDDSDQERHKRKRKRGKESDYDDRLEDEDYDLLEENLGITLKRKKEFRRIRRLSDDEEEEEEGQDREAIANELFEGSDEEQPPSTHDHVPVIEEEARDAEAIGSDAEYSEDDFIVGDDDQPIRRKKKKHIFSDQALQEAQDIFGVEFDYEEFATYDEAEEEEDEEYEDEEREGQRPRRKEVRVRKTQKKSIYEVYEPSELERSHLTDFDQEVRATDIPERMQLRSTPVVSTEKGVEDKELDEEAEWIYDQAFATPPLSSQEPNRDARLRKGPQTKVKIRNALDYMRNQHLEVPFIVAYRREYIEPDLNVEDLWTIYGYDEKWMQLKSRRDNLIRLFEKMMEYQGDFIMQDPDAPLPEGVRIISDEDIERLRLVKTSEELKDVYMHFMLYYAQDIPLMQESLRKKEQQQKKEEKERAREERRQRKKQLAEGPHPILCLSLVECFVRADAGEEGDLQMEEDEEDEEEEMDDEDRDPVKHPLRTDPYSICKRAGLGENSWLETVPIADMKVQFAYSN